jgi:hypothetical protein
MVAIDEPAFAEIGQRLPWPRGLHGRLVTALRDAGAKAVALDMIFAEPSDHEEDAALVASVDQGEVQRRPGVGGGPPVADVDQQVAAKLGADQPVLVHPLVLALLEVQSGVAEQAALQRLGARAGRDPLGRLVKVADLRDNLDVTRLGASSEQSRPHWHGHL